MSKIVTSHGSHFVETLTGLNDGDLSRLQDIMTGAFDSKNPDDVALYLPRAIEAPTADVVVARTPVQEIASVMLVNMLFGADKLRGQIDDVATHVEDLRRGYASSVLDFSIEWFRKRGVGHVALTSSDKRKPAHGLYIDKGFAIHDTNVFQLDIDSK